MYCSDVASLFTVDHAFKALALRRATVCTYVGFSFIIKIPSGCLIDPQFLQFQAWNCQACPFCTSTMSCDVNESRGAIVGKGDV
jgi:hypothetical protein